MKQLTLLLILIFAAASQLSAYPIPIRPLRMLIVESDCIIVGFVIKTEETKSKNERSYITATIAVLERLQGEVKEDTIRLTFNPGMTCPASDMYFPGTYTLAFLDKVSPANQAKWNTASYRTHALSYGSKTLEKDEIEIYKTRIAEMQDILKIESNADQEAKTVEWLVTCSENKTTTWEGVSELNYKYKGGLSAEHKERLKTALLNMKPDELQISLADLLYKDYKAELDSFLIKGLRVLNKENKYLAREYMERLKNDSPETSALLSGYVEMMYGTKATNDELRLMVDKFLTLVDH